MTRCGAEADTDPNNPGGWHILVAIADVAHYVREGSALDRDAFDRGNSVYFPVPRRADASRGALKRLVLPQAEGRAPMPVRRDVDLRRRQAAAA